MFISPEEILETVEMVQSHSLDVRTVTLGLNLAPAAHPDIDVVCDNITRIISSRAADLVPTVRRIESHFGVPIVNVRLATSAISTLLEPALSVGGSIQNDRDAEAAVVAVAAALDQAAADVGVDFIGGFSALVSKGVTSAEDRFLAALPKALASTQRVCSSVCVASTKAGINMDAVARMGEAIKEAAELTAESNGLGCAKLVVFANIPEDNPFMAGGYHGVGEADAVINVGISGPGVVRSVLENHADEPLEKIADLIKRTAFKITRAGELVARTAASDLGVSQGIVDLSLAPTTAPGDSIGDILASIGVTPGAPGTTAALSLLTDAVKKGGAMATSAQGGLSGAFIPISEDLAMQQAVRDGALSLDKLEAMTAVCSVGLDMVIVPGNTPATTLSALIADEMSIGVVNNKTTAVRIIPAPGKVVGDEVEWGGLLGGGPVMAISEFDSSAFIARGGRIPAPLRSLGN